MDISLNARLKKAGLNRKIITGALLFSAIIGFAFNYQNTLQEGTVIGAYQEIEQVFAEISASRKWVLIGDELSAREKTITVEVALAAEAEELFSASDLTYEISETPKTGTFNRSADGKFFAQVSVADLKPGEYAVVAKTQRNGNEFTSEEVNFNVSYPLYVAWTLDWEGYDVKPEYLDAIDKIADQHGTPITHFFNPRIYTSSAISEARAEYLTSWVIERNRTRGDEIALHLHMFPDMVKAAGVEPRYSPNWGSTLKDGYDILTSAYTYEETVQLLNWSRDIFAQEGLGTPISFRAGGWFADEETLRAVQDTGFKLDSSGRTKYQFGTNGIAGPWNLAETAQPYQPSVRDQNSVQSPTLDIWEFPNSGADSWAYREDQMYARFTAHFSGSPLGEKRVVTYLSHPEWFHVDNPKIEGLYTKIDRFLNSQDTGPVVYITLDQAYQIWSSE